MFSKVMSGSLTGIEGALTVVEADLSHGIPSLVIVGLPDAAVRESKERIKSAITNAGFPFPKKRITINLSPASTKKEGTHYDLPIAVSIMAAAGVIDEQKCKEYAFIGELSLDGRVNKISGALPMALGLGKQGIRQMITSCGNGAEIAALSNMKVYAVETLKEGLDFLMGKCKVQEYRLVDVDDLPAKTKDEGLDFSHVGGQFEAKRGLQIAAAGYHNILMSGPPGCGKTMLAKCILSILPKMTREEMLEVTKIYSAAGKLTEEMPIVSVRQLRAPHHSITRSGLIGGGNTPKPGEISLAHFGVLFLDELPEFGKGMIDMLRQPMEDGEVNIARINEAVVFPSRFLLVCSENPCPCGNYGSQTKACTCNPLQIEKYRNKISGPLLDRIDIRLHMQPVQYEELKNTNPKSESEKMKKSVNVAREMQLKRYKDFDVLYNAQMKTFMIKQFCVLDEKTEHLMATAYEQMNLTARAYYRILKVARTIADMEGEEKIAFHHVAEAIQYRGER